MWCRDKLLAAIGYGLMAAGVVVMLFGAWTLLDASRDQVGAAIARPASAVELARG